MQRRWWVVAVMMIIGGLLMVLAFRPWFTETDVSALISPSSVSHISVPPGFTVNLFASGLKGPRFIRFGPDGALYVAERGADRVIALGDQERSRPLQSYLLLKIWRRVPSVFTKRWSPLQTTH